MFWRLALTGILSLAVAGSVVGTLAAQADGGSGAHADVTVWVPRSGDVAGLASRGFVVDLSARFKGDLAATLASLELTGPGAHQNTAPLGGSFGVGAADHFPGLVVLLSSSKVGAGAGQNLANEFNITGVTDRPSTDETEIWATWIIGAQNAFGSVGEQTRSRLFVAVVAGTAPGVVRDLDGNGVFDEQDLTGMGY